MTSDGVAEGVGRADSTDTQHEGWVGVCSSRIRESRQSGKEKEELENNWYSTLRKRELPLAPKKSNFKEGMK